MSRRKATILCIDDHWNGLIGRKLLLEESGYEVLEATSGAEGLDLFFLRPVDAVVLDYQMPGMNGLELTRLIKLDERTNGILVLAVSANAMEADIQQARDAGCEGYITKPIDTRRFVSTVREYL